MASARSILISLVVTAVFIAGVQRTAWAAPDVQRLRDDYQSTLLEIGRTRVELAERYSRSIDEEAREAVIREARDRVFRVLTERILPAWLGTAWSFNGVSRIPGEGSIACGSFVVFTLQDAGFRMPWKMLRQPSENIIKNLVDPQRIKRFANSAPASKVVRQIQEAGKGIFIVGLEYHVGFLVNRGRETTFLHSSYYPPRQVADENPIGINPFFFSKYRVAGKLLGDRMMRKWLKGEEFSIKYNYFTRGK